MTVMAHCLFHEGEVRGYLHYHTPSEQWRVGCPQCGSFGSAEKRNEAERAWMDHQRKVLECAR